MGDMNGAAFYRRPGWRHWTTCIPGRLGSTAPEIYLPTMVLHVDINAPIENIFAQGVNSFHAFIYDLNIFCRFLENIDIFSLTKMFVDLLCDSTFI